MAVSREHVFGHGERCRHQQKNDMKFSHRERSRINHRLLGITAVSGRQDTGCDDADGNFFQLSDLENQRTQSGKLYLEFLRVPAMSAGVYVLRADASDPQSPHREEEMYYVVRGKARMTAGSGDRAVTEGSVIFVAAGVEHQFYEIEEELVALVFFAPAESA